MEIHRISHARYMNSVRWALLASIIVVGIAAAVGRATMNFNAALTDKPDVAIYLLLKDEQIGKTTVLREEEKERHYLAETPEGPKLVILKKGDVEWYVHLVEPLRE